jgi:hypothetical protein
MPHPSSSNTHQQNTAPCMMHTQLPPPPARAQSAGVAGPGGGSSPNGHTARYTALPSLPHVHQGEPPHTSRGFIAATLMCSLTVRRRDVSTSTAGFSSATGEAPAATAAPEPPPPAAAGAPAPLEPTAATAGAKDPKALASTPPRADSSLLPGTSVTARRTVASMKGLKKNRGRTSSDPPNGFAGVGH